MRKNDDKCRAQQSRRANVRSLAPFCCPQNDIEVGLATSLFLFFFLVGLLHKEKSIKTRQLDAADVFQSVAGVCCFVREFGTDDSTMRQKIIASHQYTRDPKSICLCIRCKVRWRLPLNATERPFYPMKRYIVHERKEHTINGLSFIDLLFRSVG